MCDIEDTLDTEEPEHPDATIAAWQYAIAALLNEADYMRGQSRVEDALRGVVIPQIVAIKVELAAQYWEANHVSDRAAE